MKIALLDDYGAAARTVANWSAIAEKAEIIAFHDPLPAAEAAGALAPFDIICTLRERTAFNAQLLDALPNLKLLVIVFPRQDNLDLEAASRNGVLVAAAPPAPPETPDNTLATAELTWGLIIAAARNLETEMASMRAGGWAKTYGVQLHGRTLGLLGLGRIGGQVAALGKAFGMKLLAWSENMTAEAAAKAGAARVSKAELFERSDVVSLHVRLSDRTRGLVSAEDLGRMKRGAILINTSRGPIVEEAALIAVLREGGIKAGLDVFDQEPLPADHALRMLPNVVLTPHVGYASAEALAMFYEGSMAAVAAFLDRAPIGMVNPDVLNGARLAPLGPWRRGHWPTAWPAGI